MTSWIESRRKWQNLDPEQKKRIINQIPSEKFAFYDWWVLEFAREKQLPPDDRDWFIWLLLTGRGYGKTRTGAEWVIRRALQGYGPIALIGQTKADVRDTMVELGDASILKISPKNFYPDYQPSKRRLVWPNGVIGILYSGDEPDQLRGPQHGSAWVDELAKYKYPQETWDNLMFGMRVGEDPKVVVSTTPRPIPIIKELAADTTVVKTRGSSLENIGNLPKTYINKVITPKIGTRLGRQEIDGLIIDDVEGALWTRDWIENNRVNDPGQLFRIGVAVDPAISGSGEHGIIVGGVRYIAGTLHGFILEDATRQGKPSEWGNQVVTMYHKYRADFIIGEVNQGGDMVENTIRNIRGGNMLKFAAVRATKGKYTRAEPVSALYERNIVHHVGAFPDLEDQLCSWVPGEEKSPDRLDALVWLLTFLMVDATIESDGRTDDLGNIDGYEPLAA